MGKQKELAGMPELDSAGKAALKLADIDEEFRALSLKRVEVEKNLVEILESTGRERIKVGDKLFRIRFVAEQRRISIQRDKKPASAQKQPNGKGGHLYEKS